MADKEAVEETKAEETEEAPKGGGKKLLIIGLLLGLIVGGGGAAGALIMMGGGDKHEEAHVEEVVEEVVEEEPDYDYVKINKFNVPLVHNDRILGYMTMNLSLEVVGDEDSLKVHNKLFIIRDAFLKEVSDTPVGKPGQPKVVDYASLKKRLKNRANEILHGDVVLQVLVVEARQF